MGESGKRLAINLAARIKQSYAIYDWPYSIRCLHFYFFFFFGTAYLFAYTSGKGELVQEISKIKANLLIQLGEILQCLSECQLL